MAQVNILAIIVAALSSFLLGGLWYSPVLFGPTWQRLNGDLRKPAEGHSVRVFGLSFLFALAAAFAYALIIPLPADAMLAIAQGIGVGAGVAAASFGINYQFANRPAGLWLIDGGYHTVQFGLYGLILGLWR